MAMVCFDSPSAFFEKTGAFLRERAAENNLMLGIAHHARQHPSRYRDGLFLAAGMANDKVVGAALLTRAFPLLLSGVLPEMAGLAEALRRRGLSVDGVIAEAGVCDAFVSAWRRAVPRAAVRRERPMIIYHLDRVAPLADPPLGRTRLAAPADAEAMIRFAKGFYLSAQLDQVDAAPLIADAIAERRLFLWETARPLAMAGWVRETPWSQSISLVYTDPEVRGQGIASALVAQVCQEALRRGAPSCVLFADRDNPASNRVYRKIGFLPVIEVVERHLAILPI